jgi:hypothetical protein
VFPVPGRALHPMASRKTWLWIAAVVAGLGVLALFAVAGAGVYFVTRHIDTRTTTAEDAAMAFGEARARFKDQPPLFDLDEQGHATAMRDLDTLPAGPVTPASLWILAWDPDEQRLVRLSLPLWLMKMGRRNVDIRSDHSFALEDLKLDMQELERIGPVLVIDFRGPTGERVLIWTQ